MSRVAAATFALVLSTLACVSLYAAAAVVIAGLIAGAGGDDDFTLEGRLILAGIVALPGVVLGGVAVLLWRELVQPPRL
jgi:hypothetical protein